MKTIITQVLTKEEILEVFKKFEVLLEKFSHFDDSVTILVHDGQPYTCVSVGDLKALLAGSECVATSKRKEYKVKIKK